MWRSSVLAVSSSSPATNQKSLNAGPFKRLRICPTNSHESDSNKGSSVPNHLLIRPTGRSIPSTSSRISTWQINREKSCSASLSPGMQRRAQSQVPLPMPGSRLHACEERIHCACLLRIQQHRPHRVRAIHWKRLAQQKRHEKVAHEAVPRESEEAIPRASCPRGGDPKRDFRDSSNAPGELPRAPTPPNHARCAGGARLQPQGQLPIAVLSAEERKEHWHETRNQRS